MARKIQEIMNGNVVCVTKNDTLIDAAKKMDEHDIGDVLVTNGSGKLEGIITDRDIVVRAIARGKSAEQCKVGDVCSGNVATLTPDDSVEDARRLMEKKAVRRIPIVRDGKPVGIVSIGDLAVKGDGEAALEHISAAPPNN